MGTSCMNKYIQLYITKHRVRVICVCICICMCIYINTYMNVYSLFHMFGVGLPGYPFIVDV